MTSEYTINQSSYNHVILIGHFCGLQNVRKCMFKVMSSDVLFCPQSKDIYLDVKEKKSERKKSENIYIEKLKSN